jgi:hypothetical protein
LERRQSKCDVKDRSLSAKILPESPGPDRPATESALGMAVCSRSQIVLDFAGSATACTLHLFQERPCAGARQERIAVPSAATDLQLDFLGLSAACADGKKHGCEPVFGRRALYGSCQAGEPGNTCVLRLRRRQYPPTLPLHPLHCDFLRSLDGRHTHLFALKDYILYETLLVIRVCVGYSPVLKGSKRSHQHRKQALHRGHD